MHGPIHIYKGVSMKKNILVILTDQHTYTTLSAYGKSVVKTPNLDQLSKESLIFDQAYTVCPICTPARASFQTGVYPSKHGMVTNVYTKGCMVHELPDNEHLLSRRLQSVGYRIGYTGKWHLGAGKNKDILGGVEYPFIADLMKHSGLPSDVGYEGDDFAGHGGIGDTFSSFQNYLKLKGLNYTVNLTSKDYPRAGEITSGKESAVPHYLVDRTIETIESFRHQNQPFFFMLNFWQPHEPYLVPTEYLDIYRHMELDPWETYAQQTEGLPMIHNVERSMHGNWEKIQEYVKYYYAAITQIDDEIGRLFGYLKAKNLYDNTVIMFSADHGETLGVHQGLSDKGLDMYEETVHIPLFLRIPGYKHQRFNQLVQTCDLYSTVLDIAGVDLKLAERDGTSIMRILAGKPWREYLVSESSGLDYMSYTQRMIRKGEFKFVFHPAEVDELYDLNHDPYEKVNLATQHEYYNICIDMLHLLRKWLVENKDGLIVRYDNLMQAKVQKYSQK
jgi:arylsulfatase A-like enzyme